MLVALIEDKIDVCLRFEPGLTENIFNPFS
jgi:hypothetical protein